MLRIIHRFYILALAAFVFTALLGAVSSAAATARRITYTPASPVIGETITFHAEDFPSNRIFWDFGDGGAAICLGVSTTHAYSRAGTFIIKAKGWCGDDAVTTTASITIAAGRSTGPLSLFRISYIQLRFQDGKPTQSVSRNARLVAYADIKYEGTGTLQGWWQVDGRNFNSISQSLTYARSVTIDSGIVPGLPTQESGRHEVTLRISSPTYDAFVPVIRYTVSSEEEKPDLRRPKQAESLHIAGKVQYRHRKQPVAGATVEYRVYDPKARSESSKGIAVHTDDLGQFVITAVKPESSFRLHVYGKDFRAAVQEGFLSDKSIDQLAVVVEDLAGGIQIGGVVIYWWAKTPAPEMNVVYRTYDPKTNSAIEASKKTAVTDSQGRFDFFGIPPGSVYLLEISSPSHAPEIFKGKVGFDNDSDLSLEIKSKPMVNEVTPTVPAAGSVVTIKGFDLTWPFDFAGPGQIFLELAKHSFTVEQVLRWDMGRIDFVIPDKTEDGEYLMKLTRKDGSVIATWELTCQGKPYEISVEDFQITGCQLLDWDKSLFRLEVECTLKNSGSRTFSDNLIFKLLENALFKEQKQEKFTIASGESSKQKWTFSDYQFAEGDKHDFTIQVFTDPQKSDVYRLDDKENNISQPAAYNPQPRIESFTGTREGETKPMPERLYINWGEKVTLAWKASGAQQVSLLAPGWKQDSLEAGGSLEVRPDADTTYTLSASLSKRFTAQAPFLVGVDIPKLEFEVASSTLMNGGQKNELFFYLRFLVPTQGSYTKKLFCSDVTILVDGIENGNDQVGRIHCQNGAIFFQASNPPESKEINLQVFWKPNRNVSASLTFTILPVYDFKPAVIKTFTADGQSEYLLLDAGKSVLYRWEVVISDTMHTILDKIAIEKSVANATEETASACQFKESPKVIKETTELQGEISDIAEYCPPSGFNYTLRVYSHDKNDPSGMNDIKSKQIAVAPYVYSMAGEDFVLLGNVRSLSVTCSKSVNVNDFDWTVNGLAPKDAEQAGLGALVFSGSERFVQYNAPLLMPAESPLRIMARHKTNGAQVAMIMRLDERLNAPFLAPGGDWWMDFCAGSQKQTLCEYEETEWSDTWFALRGRGASICANPTNPYYQNLRIGWQITEGEGELVSGYDTSKRGKTVEDARCIYFTSSGDSRLAKVRIWLLDYPKITPTELCISICSEIEITSFTPTEISPRQTHLTINGYGFKYIKEIIIAGKKFNTKEYTVRQLSPYKIEMEFSNSQIQGFDDSKLWEPFEMTSNISQNRVKSSQKLRIRKQ